MSFMPVFMFVIFAVEMIRMAVHIIIIAFRLDLIPPQMNLEATNAFIADLQTAVDALQERRRAGVVKNAGGCCPSTLNSATNHG